MKIAKQDQHKAADVVAHILKLEGVATYEFILRVLALADAMYLEEAGTPMGGLWAHEDLKNPLETHVRHMVSTGGYPYWDHFIAVDGNTVRVVRDPGGDQLSEYDEEILFKVLMLIKRRTAREEFLAEAAAAGVTPTEEDIAAIQTEWDKPPETMSRFYLRVNRWNLTVHYYPYGLRVHFPWSFLPFEGDPHTFRWFCRAHDSESLWWSFLGTIEVWKML